MKKIKKLTALTLAGAMVLSTAACGSGGSDGENSSGDENVTIQFMHSMIEEERQQTIQGIIDRFEEENPGITVEQVPTSDDSTYDTKLTAYAGGGMPAVIEVNQNRAKWLVGNGFTDMDAVGEVIAAKEGDYYDAILKINTSEDGESYIGVPVGGWVQGIWYNKTAFDEKGLAAPDTWENILTAAKAFHDPDNKKYGIALPTEDGSFSEQSFSQFALSNGANALDADGNAAFSSDEMVEALEFYKELYSYSIQGANGSTEVKDAIMNGSVPMGIYSTYILQDLINAGMMDDFGFALVKNKESVSYGSVGMLTITNDLSEAEREAAIKFVEFVTEKENNIEWLHMAPGGQQPVMPEVAEDPSYLDNEVIKGFEALAPEISSAFANISLFGIVDGKNFVSMGDVTTSNVIGKAIYDMTVNGQDAAATAESVQTEIEEIIAE